MDDVLFVTDLHGQKSRYKSLFSYLKKDPPKLLLIGGDLFSLAAHTSDSAVPGKVDFIHNYLMANFIKLRSELENDYPQVFLIMGNDDPRFFESALIAAGKNNLWQYIHKRKICYKSFPFFGYNYVPPTPFMLKDWERYDVSRYTDIGCVSPEEGTRSFPVSEHEKKWTTIKEDLDQMTENTDLGNAVFLFHGPPYKTNLDWGETNGQMIDYVPVDEHMGSIAVKRFIEERQPLLTLHGHIHESTSKSGKWIEKIGRTVCINGAHNGDELSVVRLQLENPENAERFLL